jgi:hypothetical protein
VNINGLTCGLNTTLSTLSLLTFVSGTRIGGGTNLFYKLLGVVFCLIGFLVMTNLWTAFLQATLGSLFPKPTVR